MFEVSAQQTFAAGHALRNYHGKCENVHGHNYRVQVTVSGEQLNAAGLVVDFVELKRLMSEVIERLDHRFLNDVAPFDVLNPSAENLAKYFWDQISGALKSDVPVEVSEVRVWETDTSIAVYRP